MTVLECSSTQRNTGASRWCLPIIATVVLVTGGGAYAGIPSANVIDGCYTKSGGAIRVIDPAVTQCKSSETAISWNVVGPQGSIGPTGPQGATGAAGPQGAIGAQGAAGPQGAIGAQGVAGVQGAAGAAGVSDAYIARLLDVENIAGDGVNMVSLLLPPGNYVINAKAIVSNGSADARFAFCNLNIGDGSGSSGAGLLGHSSLIGRSDQTIAMQDAASFVDTFRVVLRCGATGNDVFAYDTVLTAIKVDTLH